MKFFYLGLIFSFGLVVDAHGQTVETLCGTAAASSCQKVECVLGAYTPFRRTVEKTPGGLPRNTYGIPIEIVLRARATNQAGDNLGNIISEGNAGHASSRALQFSGWASQTIIESNFTSANPSKPITEDQVLKHLSYFDTAAQRARAESVANTRLADAVKANQADPSARVLDKNEYVPKLFTLADQTRIHPGNGYSILGIRFQVKGADGTIRNNTILVKLRLNAATADGQKQSLTKVATNLVYIATNNLNNANSFLETLTEEARGHASNGRREVEVIGVSTQGEDFHSLNQLPISHDSRPQIASAAVSDPHHAAAAEPSLLERRGYPPSTVFKATRVGEKWVVLTEEVGGGPVTADLLDMAGVPAAEANIAQAQQAVEQRFHGGQPIKGSSISKNQLELKLNRTKTERQRERANEIGEARWKAALARHQASPHTVPAPKPREFYNPPMATLANTVVTKAGDGKAWVGLDFQTQRPDGKMDDNRIMLEIKMSSQNTEQQKMEVAKIMAALSYSAMEHRNRPDLFIKGLTEDFRPELSGEHKEFEITTISIEGHGLSVLKAHEPQIVLSLIGKGAEQVYFNTVRDSNHEDGHEGHAVSSSSSTFFRNNGIIVVDEDVLEETPKILEESNFKKKRAELATAEGGRSEDFTIVAQIVVPDGHVDIDETEKKIKEVDHDGGATVVTTRDIVSDPTIVPRWGAKRVYAYRGGNMILVSGPK